MLPWHCILSSRLRYFDQIYETSLALFKPVNNGLLWELREVFVLDDKIVEIISKIVSTGSSSMPIEDSKKADLRPLNVEVLLALGLQNVENNGHSVFVVVSDNALISVSCVRLDNSTLLLRGFGWLVILQKEGLWVQNGRIFSKK